MGGLDIERHIEGLLSQFERRSGRTAAGVWSAPGRANLIGEHLDYNGGTVTPYALSLRTYVAAAPRDDGRIRGWSMQLSENFDLSLADARRASGWAGYAAGTAWAMREAGCACSGVDLLIDGGVPLGSGLSSSAALECAVALAINDLAGGALDRMTLARAGQRAEHDVAGAPTGLMDQVGSLFARPGEVVVFDTARGAVASTPLPLEPTATCVLIANSGSRHDNAGGEYAERRRSCEVVAQRLGIGQLAAAELDDLRMLAADPVLLRRSRHVISEQRRVGKTLEALAAGDMAAVGELLTDSHRSLQRDFEVSTHELDEMVDAALAAGALGARMIGGGFGGCVLILARREQQADLTARLRAVAAESGRPEPEFYDGRPGDGARRHV